jgi:DNA-binding NarL/FixJ family response regulator
VAEGASGADALSATAELRPDVLILDVNLPDINGLDVTRRLRARGDITPIVILTVHNDSQTVLGLLEAGATGYVLKDEALDRLADAVRAVAHGETWLSPAVAGQVVRRAVLKDPYGGSSAGNSGSLSPLTPRELEVLRLLAQGLDNEAIAQRLVLTKRTVQNHISIIYDKLGVTSRTEALLHAVQHGWAHLS